MSKIVSIKEDEHSRFFSNVKKLVTNTAEGLTATWVPEDEAADYVEKQTLTVTENGTYKAKEGTIFDEVDVNVAPKKGDDETDEVQLISSKEITSNGTYKAADDAGVTDSKQAGYESVTVALPLESKTITENGVYNAADDVDENGNQIQGFSSLDVQVGDGSGRQISKTIKKNGTYKPEEEPNDGKGEIEGYNQVDVALPLMEKKVIDHGGTFRPQAEQDENGDEYQGYKSIEVNIKITQPVMNFTMKVDHQPAGVIDLLPEISIDNTDPDYYLSYEMNNPPTVDFSQAKIRCVTDSVLSPFMNRDLDLQDGRYYANTRMYKAPPFDYTDKYTGEEVHVTDIAGSMQWGKQFNPGNNQSNSFRGEITTADAWFWYNHILDKTGQGPRDYMGSFRVRTNGSKVLYIVCGKFCISGTDFAISNNNHSWWVVSNINYSAGQSFSYTITADAPHE